MLVSDINRQFPQCRPVFEKYGIAGCGGADGPPEPLFLFAAAHRVPLPDLLAELNQASRGEWQEPPQPAPTELESEQLYKGFVLAALTVALTLGFGLGLVNLLRIAAAGNYYEVSGVLKQLHGHAQVFGWVGLFIMGVAYHAVPRMKMQPLRPLGAARASLFLMVAGLALRATGFRWAGLGSAGLELAAVGLFVGLLAGVGRRSDQAREPYENFIGASGLWFLVLAIGNVWIVGRGMPALWHALWIHAALYGFIANMIFGFSLRILPHFLGLREAKPWAIPVAFWAWNVAIFFRYPLAPLAWTASVLEAVAIGTFLYALGIFAKRRVKIEIAGVDNSFEWFIRLGYAWLVVVAATPFHADIFRLSASARHIMALGFITPLMFGVAYRVLPIFNGVNLWSPRLMRGSFWALAFGNTLGLAMAFNKAYETAWIFVWSAAAGCAVAVAVGLLAVNLLQTLRTQAEKYRPGAPVKPTTRVAELLEAVPEIRPVLIHNGLGGLAALRHNPPRFVTIEFAARRHGIDPQPLLAVLNEEIQRRKP
jgi:hypothetical protein